MRCTERLEWSKYQEVLASLTDQGRWRDVLVWLVPGYTALRVGDLTALRWADLKQKKVAVKQRKTGKTVPISLSDRFMEHFLAAEIALKIRDDNSFIFARQRGGRPGQPMTRHGVTWRLKQIADEFGLGPVSPHSLRKTNGFATYVALGANHYALSVVSSKLFAHSNTGTTLTYLGISASELEAVQMAL